MRRGATVEDDATILDLMAKRKRQEALFVYLPEELSARLEKHRARLEKHLLAQAGGAKVKVTKADIVRKFIEDGLAEAEAPKRKK